MAGVGKLTFFTSTENAVSVETIVPLISNFSNIEKLSVSGDVGEKNEFNNLQSIEEIEITSGIGLIGSTAVLGLSANQSLALTNIKDGDNIEVHWVIWQAL